MKVRVTSVPPDAIPALLLPVLLGRVVDAVEHKAHSALRDRMSGVKSQIHDFLALSTDNPKGELSPSTLIIEQAEKKITSTKHMSEVVEKKHWKVNADHCALSVVFARKKDLEQGIATLLYKGDKSNNDIKDLGKYTSEPFRRISLSLAFLTLTLAGALSGIQSRRKTKKEKYLVPIFLFGFYLACYLAGKSMDSLPWPAIVCYLLPHPLLLIASWKLKQHAEHCKG